MGVCVCGSMMWVCGGGWVGGWVWIHVGMWVWIHDVGVWGWCGSMMWVCSGWMGVDP